MVLEYSNYNLSTFNRMELALAAGLALAGYEFMDRGEKPAPPRRVQRDNIYDSRQVARCNADLVRRAVILDTASKRTAVTGVVPNFANRLPNRRAWESVPDDGLDGASFSTFGSLSDNESGGAPNWLETEAKLAKPLQKQQQVQGPNYTEMFQPMSFDNPGGAVGSNDIAGSTSANNMVAAEAGASLQGGWSTYDKKDMSYNVVSPGKLMNFRDTQLVPYFSAKSYGGDEDVHRRDGNIQNRLELFTGDNNIKPSKREVEPLFQPTRNAGNVHGTPVMTEFEMSRYYVSERKDGEKPFQPVQVSPGLAMDYNESGTGLMPSYNYRNMPKTVDQLRLANKAKKSYTAPVIPGQKGTSRGIQAPVNKYRPYRTASLDHEDLQRTSFVTTAPTTRENYNFDPTNRQQTSTVRLGARNAVIASVGDNGGYGVRGKVQASIREVLDPYNPGHAGQQGGGGIRRENYQLYENQRMETEQTRHIGTGYQPMGNVAYDPTDVPDVTMRQMTAADTGMYSAMSGYARTALQSNDGAKPTLRQVTLHQLPGHNVTGDFRRAAAMDHTDIRDPTGRQIIENNKYLGTTTGAVGAVTAYWDPIAINFKETTLNPQIGAGFSGGDGGWAKTDIVLDPTQRQMTAAHAPGLVGYTQNAGYLANPQQAFATMRQDTEQTSHLIGASGANKRGGGDANPQQAPVTLKQLFESTKHIANAGQAGQQGGYSSNPQQSITTLRQFTESTKQIAPAGQYGKHGGYGANPQQVAQTQRVGYEGTRQIGVAESANKQSGSSANPQQMAATQRMDYEGTRHIGGADHAGQHGGYGSNPQQSITTLRQFTESTKLIGGATGAVGGGGYESNPMVAGPTTRQSTIYERTGGNHGQDKYTPYVSFYGAEMGDKT